MAHGDKESNNTQLPAKKSSIVSRGTLLLRRFEVEWRLMSGSVPASRGALEKARICQSDSNLPRSQTCNIDFDFLSLILCHMYGHGRVGFNKRRDMIISSSQRTLQLLHSAWIVVKSGAILSHNSAPLIHIKRQSNPPKVLWKRPLILIPQHPHTVTVYWPPKH